MFKKQQDIVKQACEATSPQSEALKLLLERLRRNEVYGSTLSYVANMWKHKSLINKDLTQQIYGDYESDDTNLFEKRRQRLQKRNAEKLRVERHALTHADEEQTESETVAR